MSARETVAVVGAGLAAAHAVEALRAGGYDGHLVLYGTEPHQPYERPPLSKGYLLGNDERDAAFPHPAAWYDERDVDLRLTTTVTALDLDRHEVLTGDHRQRFDRLLLCTGATPRRLAMADRSGAPVAYLRTLEDCERLRDALRPGTRLVIVGAGWIGLEVAAAARAADCAVTVVETLDLPLLRVLGPEVAQVFADLHRAHGVDLRLATGVGGIVRDGELADVHLTDGSTLLADLVLVAVGAAPGTALAEAAGLDVDDGVVVDARLRTSHPDVLAAGDVARAFHPLLGRHLRVEHWDNAIGQGAVAGRNLGGATEEYDRLPYFFTDQYDLGMEYVGAVGPEGYDEVVLRGDVPGRVFTAFWLREGRVLAGMHVNDWDAIDPVRTIVARGAPDVARLRDDSVPLTDLTG